MSGRGERGVVTAEMAVGTLGGAVLLVIVAWALGLGVTQLRAMDAATQVARQEARGNHELSALISEHDPGAHVMTSREAGRVSATVTFPAPGLGPFLPARSMTATAVAQLEPGES